MVTNYFDYFDHDADIGIIGYGNTLEESFVQAARAVFAYMVDLSSIKSNQTIAIEFEENDEELALVRWLNQLLGEARQNDMVFANFQLQRQGDRWVGSASGEKWRKTFERGTEVKGATLTMLSVTHNDAEWKAGCVIDV